MSELVDHYGDGTLRDRVFAALAEAGIAKPTVEDLAPFDEFHVRGLEASRELVALAGFSAQHHLLDIGCGVGGPARFLVSATGAKVTGVDLTEEFCQLAAELSEAVGLSRQTNFKVGDALNLPFDNETFDGVWIQHVNMNIPEKESMYREAHRVLKPGGKLATHEIVAREGEVIFPVPWAPDPRHSFLVSAQELRLAWESAGFQTLHFKDDTAESIQFFQAVAEQNKTQGLSTIGIHLIFGDRSRELFGNVKRNLEEGHIGVVMAVGQK